MFKKAGKMLAVIMSAAVAVTPLAGTLPVYADELELMTDDSLENETVSLEELSSEDLTSETDTDDGSGMNQSDEELSDFGAAEEDLNDIEEDVPEIDNDAPGAPETNGKVIRLAKAGTGIQKDQHIYFGKDGGSEEYIYEDKVAGTMP